MTVLHSKNGFLPFVQLISAGFGLFQYPKLFYLVNIASTTFAFLFLVQIKIIYVIVNIITFFFLKWTRGGGGGGEFPHLILLETKTPIKAQSLPERYKMTGTSASA
jgi:hypothetical protein